MNRSSLRAPAWTRGPSARRRAPQRHGTDRDPGDRDGLEPGPLLAERREDAALVDAEDATVLQDDRGVDAAGHSGHDNDLRGMAVDRVDVVAGVPCGSLAHRGA